MDVYVRCPRKIIKIIFEKYLARYYFALICTKIVDYGIPKHPHTTQSPSQRVLAPGGFCTISRYNFSTLVKFSPIFFFVKLEFELPCVSGGAASLAACVCIRSADRPAAAAGDARRQGAAGVEKRRRDGGKTIICGGKGFTFVSAGRRRKGGRDPNSSGIVYTVRYRA